MDLQTLSQLQTETVNARTVHIDQLATLDLCQLINEEDQRVASSITPFLPQIATAIDALSDRVRRGGRVIYVGAGTSGRLGILDASEIPPTFAAPPSQFIGIIAGGDAAIRQAQEGAEDSVSLGESDLEALNLDPDVDSVIGIAASGRTPYVLACMAFAKHRGCLTVGIACAAPSAMSQAGTVDIVISPLPGPEVVTGSTRLKAGTATKLVLNMLSTGTMIRIGKTYGNMMVDMVASNKKLEQRSRNILRRLSRSCEAMTDEDLDSLLLKCDGSVKLSLLVAETNLAVGDCRRHLELAGGVLAKALSMNATTSHRNSHVQETDQRFVLCIDGGATKCAATIADHTGAIIGQGRTGACNLTDNPDINDTVRLLMAATHDAMEQSPTKLLPSQFQSIWIGLAGIDRNGLASILMPSLCDAFGVPAEKIRLTNDVDLLAGAMIRHQPVPSAIVVIAGTGSVTMRYQWDVEDRQPTRLARSGGWGHLLGDEGGGYAIGLQAVKHTLAALEDLRLGVSCSASLGEFDEAVLQRLGCQFSNSEPVDLISDLLAQQQRSIAKSRIASVAEVVVNRVSGDDLAAKIVMEQMDHLVNSTLGRLLHPQSTGFMPLEQTGLILSGGLFKNPDYRNLFLERLKGFAYVTQVDNAASMAVAALI
ncbi:hypothetical protein FE257_001437 [Aspergillus nanangensis]|uniref:N-acetyl-D-glucosamine kinase n=1 Tax=Aspergillus nanangensis TaxID=2582783 RepID=A0AAD4CDT3_ASPNN|nr:hypothetical protein FE257_001437 [Aspergillus nanangensis]